MVLADSMMCRLVLSSKRSTKLNNGREKGVCAVRPSHLYHIEGRPHIDYIDLWRYSGTRIIAYRINA